MSSKIRRILRMAYKLPFLVLSLIGGSLSTIQNMSDKSLS
jgi:hypothetical protein